VRRTAPTLEGVAAPDRAAATVSEQKINQYRKRRYEALHAENAAANAWRTGQLAVVPAATTGGQGAIVTPLFGLHSCIGVLSAEVRQGENSPSVQAVATMIAAQLSTVVPAWPAGSLTPADRASSSAARSA